MSLFVKIISQLILVRSDFAFNVRKYTCYNWSFIKLYSFESKTLFNKLKMEKSKKPILKCLLYEYQFLPSIIKAVFALYLLSWEGKWISW